MDRQLTHLAPSRAVTLRYPSQQHAHPTQPDLAQMPGIVGGTVWSSPSPSLVAAGEHSHQRHLGDTAKKHVISVCQGRACTAKGGAALLQAFRRQASSEVIVRPCKCRDACKSAPVVQIQSSAGKQLVKVREWMNKWRCTTLTQICFAQRVRVSDVQRLLANHICSVDIEDSAE